LLIRQRDESALKCFYYRHYTALCRKAFRRIQNDELVEEIVQDVFFTLWTKATELDADGNVSAWIYAVLRNKVLHAMREEMRREDHLSAYQQASRRQEDNAYSMVEAKQAAQRVRLLIDGLPAQCKEAFLLSREHHLTYQQIADRMGVSVKTVEKHISRALQILRTEVGQLDAFFLLWMSMGVAIS